MEVNVRERAPTKESRRIEAVLWDLDGTLVDSEPLHQAALIAPFRHAGLSAPEDLHERTIGKTADQRKRP